jgi:pyruvate dehydrogenase E1 component alpha subunit
MLNSKEPSVASLQDDNPMPVTMDIATAIIRLRYWQHLLNEMLKQKKFKIPIHLAFGHESAAVAVDRCMGADDVLCLSHRNAAYNLVRSKSLRAVLDHYLLVSQSNHKGFMGSMNLAVADSGILYTSSILGNDLPVAAGIAMNRSLLQKPGVAFVFTGDGAMEEGVFWETMIFARSHKLPLVIVVENDNHSMSSTIAQRRSSIDLSLVCAGVGIAYQKVDGAAIGGVLSSFRAARASAERGEPACIELQLATFNQHAGPTPGWPDDPLRISLDDGLVVRDTPEDPVHLIRQELGDADFRQLADEIMKAEAL